MGRPIARNYRFKCDKRVRDVRLPPKLVGAIAIGGLVVASVLGCFIILSFIQASPSELSAVNAETCSRAMSGDTFGALHWIPVYEDQLKKLEVGIRLRGGNLTKNNPSHLCDRGNARRAGTLDERPASG